MVVEVLGGLKGSVGNGVFLFMCKGGMVGEKFFCFFLSFFGYFRVSLPHIT